MPFTDSVIVGGGEEYTVVNKGNVQISFVGRDLIFLNVYFVLGMSSIYYQLVRLWSIHHNQMSYSGCTSAALLSGRLEL